VVDRSIKLWQDPGVGERAKKSAVKSVGWSRRTLAEFEQFSCGRVERPRSSRCPDPDRRASRTCGALPRQDGAREADADDQRVDESMG
jgi:hypothetical protein